MPTGRVRREWRRLCPVGRGSGDLVRWKLNRRAGASGPKHDGGDGASKGISVLVKARTSAIHGGRLRSPAEDIGIDMRNARPVANVEVILLERQHPPGMLPDGGRLLKQPEQRLVIRDNLEVPSM
jgi:hypothetical protein